MPRPKGYSPVYLYPHDKQVRVPRASLSFVEDCVRRWEVSTLRTEVAELRATLRAIRAPHPTTATKPGSSKPRGKGAKRKAKRRR